MDFHQGHFLKEMGLFLRAYYKVDAGHGHNALSTKSLRLCLTLCDSMDCSLQGCSVHGVLQARILAWVAIPFSKGSFPPGDGTWVSHIIGQLFTI